MTRYFFYLVLLNMLVNVLVYVPSILLKYRFNGAVLAIPIGILIGTLLTIVFQSSLNRFPNQDLPEILSQSTPKWFKIAFLLLLGIAGFATGALTLLAYNNLAIRFINPDFAGVRLMALFSLCIVLMLSHLKTDKILYTLEMMVVLSLPLILTITYQAYNNAYLTWNSVFEVISHWQEVPSWSAISAAAFVFSGFSHMVIYFKHFKDKIKLRFFWIIPILGLFNLITTFCIPIGIHGANGVADYTFPWVATADSLQIEYGPVERTISVFLLLYLGIAFLSVVVQWHVAYQLLLGISNHNKSKARTKKYVSWFLLFIFASSMLLLEKNLREEGIFQFGEVWLNIRFPIEVLTVAVIWFLARRKVHAEADH